MRLVKAIGVRFIKLSELTHESWPRVDQPPFVAHSFGAVVDLIFLFVLMGVTILATITVIVRANMQRQERRDTDRTWDGFARSRLAATPAPARRESPTAATEPSEIAQMGKLPTHEPVRLLALGKEGVRYTVMEAQLSDALCARLVCTTEKARTTSKIKTGVVAITPMFDQVFRTETSPAGLARTTLTTEMQRRLVAFSMGQPLRFAYDRGWVSLKWPGHEKNDARLDEALRLLTLATATFREAYGAETVAPTQAAS